jgi:citrate synthase
MLTTEQVARRLGVKPATVYAYVSRGLLTSERNADGKASRFREAEVEAFAAGRRRAAPDDAPAIHTGLTLIDDGHLYYRGHDAVTLAGQQSYESVVTLLWTGELRHVPLRPAPALRELGEAVTAPLPASARLTDRLRVICAAAAAADPLRFDTAPAAVIATGRAMLGTMVAALPLRAVPPAGGDPGAGAASPAAVPPAVAVPPVAVSPVAVSAVAVSPPAAVSSAVAASAAGAATAGGVDFAAALWQRLTPAAPLAADLFALNAALVLLADHDIAASTLAARVAASTRAHPYAVVGAGLATLDGPLHGAASTLAYELLADAVRTGDPVATISDRLRVGGRVPGFGHPLYPDGDPRATTLLALLSDAPDRAVIEAVAAAVTERSGTLPNIDFAIAAFALLNGMSADAGEAIFAVARTAGWIAHALEEYGDRPSRFRPSGRYAGRPPAA